MIICQVECVFRNVLISVFFLGPLYADRLHPPEQQSNVDHPAEQSTVTKPATWAVNWMSPLWSVSESQKGT